MIRESGVGALLVGWAKAPERHGPDHLGTALLEVERAC